MTNFLKFAYQLGAQQYRQGRDIHANPYKVKSSSWYQWRQGWNSEALK